MTKTDDNLADAFAGESQANRKYLAFALQAEKDGYPQIAKLFRSVAAAETVHAHNHLRQMGGVKSTQENLKGARGGENYEIESMYPPMIKQAKEDGNKGAQRSFSWALMVEKIHRDLYDQALEKIEEDEDLPEEDIHVCKVCGHTVRGEAPDKCPTCGAKKEMFEKIE